MRRVNQKEKWLLLLGQSSARTGLTAKSTEKVPAASHLPKEPSATRKEREKNKVTYLALGHPTMALPRGLKDLG